LYGDRFATVRDYFATGKNLVEVVDLPPLVPGWIRSSEAT